MENKKLSRKEALDTLEVKSDASADEIKKAFRTLSKIYHPDTNREADAEKKKIADAKYKEITRAYDALTKDSSKNDTEAPAPDPLADLDEWREDTEETIKISKPCNGKDFETKIKIDIQLARLGGKQEIVYKLNGARRSVKIKIPMGTSNGKKIRAKGKGYPGTFGGKAGDLYILIEVTSEKTETDFSDLNNDSKAESKEKKKVSVPGSDIKVVHNIDYPMALRGGQIMVKYSADGQMMSKQIHLQSGKTETYLLTFKGEGTKGTFGGKAGDLSVHIVVAKPLRGKDIDAYATISASHALSLMFSRSARVPTFDFASGKFIRYFEKLDRSHRDGSVYKFEGEGGRGEQGAHDGDLNLHVHYSNFAKGAKFLIPGAIAIAVVIAVVVNSGPQSDTYFPDDVTYDQNYDNQGGSGSSTDSNTEDPGTPSDNSSDPGAGTGDATTDEGATGGIGDTTQDSGNDNLPDDSGSTQDKDATGGIG